MATNDNNRDNPLKELGGSSYEIVDGQPDIRGWDVKNARGEKIGEVEDLIFDTNALKVRYIVLDLEGNVLDLEPRNVLVPIGLAELHEIDDEVYLENVTTEQLSASPKYTYDTFDSSFESTVRSVFGGGTTAAAGATDMDYYDHDHYNEDNLYRRRNTSPDTGNPDSATIPVVEEDVNIGTRTVETGGARIRSKVTEEPVEENINLHEEHVNVERNPVNRPASGDDMKNFTEGVIEVTEHKEVPVVEKEARVVEEISIDKDVDERTETIHDTERKMDVDIENLDQTRDPNRNRDLDRDLDDRNRDRNSPAPGTGI